MSRLKSLFSDALTFSGSERALFIQESTREDETLRDELSSLLEAHERSDSWFERLAEELIAPALVALDSESEADAEPANRTVSHYEILERTGGGGMGVVYKAQDTRLGRLVALKFLPRHHASNPSARARLMAEARPASRPDHANIGTVYEIGEADDGRQFIAMAWYEGETLKEKIRRDRLSVQESVSIALQLGSALSAAHPAGIIHRDVKPANVMMAADPGFVLVRYRRNGALDN